MALTANQDWLYKQMSERNVDLGSEEQFAQAMQDESNRQWVYEQAGKMGIDLGTPEQFASAMQMPEVAEVQKATGGVSGGSLLSEQEELARQNAIQGVTNDPNHPFMEGEKKQPNAFQTFYKGLGAGVINTANGLLGFLNRANSGRLAYDPVTLQQMAKQGKSPEEIAQVADATRARLDSAETERYNAWKAKADQLSAEAKPDGGEKSFTDYISEGKIGKALQLGLGTAAESLPYTASALNPVATASMIMSMSEQNYRQSLIDNPDMSDGRRLASAAGDAAIEMAVEHIGNPFKVFKAGKLTSPNATKWIKQVVKESKDNIYKGILRVLGFGAKEAGKEGLEEVVTTAGQDLYNTLLDWKDTNGLGLRSQWERMKEQNPDITPEEFAMYKAEGLTNDFIGGALSGMMMSGPSTGVGVARAAKYYSKNGGSEESRAQAQQQLAVLQQLATEFDVTEEEVAQAIVDYQAEKQLTPKQQALINRGEEIITNLQNAQSATQATEPQETVQLTPAAAEYQRAVDEVTQSVRERTHGNGYIYPVAMPGNAEKTGFIVGEVVPVIDESNPEQLRIENDDIVTVKWSDGTVTQERARDLDLTGAPMIAQQAIDIEVENQMYAYTQQRIQNGEQPVLMRNGEGILEGFFPKEGGLLEDQNGVQYTQEQLAEQGWQETKPVLFVNDTQQIAALDNGDGTYTQVDALGNPIAEPMSAEAFREQGFAMVPLEKEQPKSQAPGEAPANTGEQGMQTPVFTIPQEDGVTYSHPVKIWQTKKGRVLADIKKTYTDKDGNKVTEVVTINPDGSTVISNATIPLEGYSLTGGSIETFDGFEIIGFKKLIELPSRQRVVDARDVNDKPIYREQDAVADVIVKGEDGVPFSARVPLIKSEQAPAAPQAPEVQQPEVQEPAAPVVPNIETMSAADYAGAAVEYMGSREYVDEYLDGEIKKVQQQLDVANLKKVGNVTDMADFKAKKDAIEAEKKALQDRLDKLTEAREKAKSYLTIAEREQRAKAEAERRAAEEAARIAREQAAAAEAARLEQERIDRELKKGVPDFSEDNDRDARNRGFHVVNGQVIHRQEPLQPLATGKAVTVQFAKGQNGAAEAHHVLIPVSMAQPSHINGQRNPAFFISEAQPKDRRDQVSKFTSDMMAQNIHPDEIVEGATAYVGAPVLNGRGEAVQGNNRLDALIKMYQSHPESVAKYKQYLIDNAEALGYTEADIETIRNNDVIDVRMLDNVTDEQAIQLGQKKATDLETGGVQLIDPQVTANQLGDRIQRFSEILLKSNDDEATLADLTLRNGRPALEFLQQLGIISDAQMQSAFDSRGNLTAEAKAALQGVLKQVLFQNAESDNLPIMFDDIPVTAQKAILQTIVRDLQSPEESRLVPDIQEAIGALYRALHQSAEVKNSRNEQETRAAMRSWAIQMQFPSDFDAENFVPSEIFSNFALELATLFKYGKQTEVAKKLNAYYDAVQGTTGGLFGDTPAIPYKEAIKQIFGIDYKSVDEARREKHRKELTDYLNTIADEAHPFELYGNDNFIDLLIQLGTSPRKIEYVRNQLANGKTFDGFTIKNKLYLNTDGLDTTEKARSKYIHERQHLLTTKEQIERVMRAASREELDVLVEVLSQSGGAYSNESHDILADEFISYSMEEAYAVESDEGLESILRAAGANDELINIIKSINNEQRENDERLGQSERLGNARRPADVRTDSQGHSPQNGRDQGKEPGVLEQTGAGTTERGGLGGRTGGENRGSTEGAGLSEVGSEGVSGEEAGGAGDNAGIAGENQGSSGFGQERGLGEVTQSPSDNRETSETRATETEIGGALVDRLGDMGVSVSTDLEANRAALKAAKADKSDAGAIHYYKTPSGQQYGFSYKGRIYLDPTKIDAELPIHEYGHLWAEAMRRISPDSWRSVVDTIKADQASWDFVRALRPELTDENEIAEEVIATFSGKRGAERLRAEYKKMHGKDADYKSKWGNIFQNISKAIQDFWKAVGDFLNIKYQSAEQIYDQVLKDFVDNMNPYQKVRDFLRARDAEYIQAAESGDIQKATNIFYDALRENIGNGITPYMSVGTYLQFKRLAKGVKTRDAAIIREAAEKIAPLIPDNAVLVPTPSHTGRATDMLDLANAIAEITGSEVADILRSAPRESQYQAKKETGTPIASQQLGIMMEGTVPADKTAIVIDNVVDSGNTAEACIQALGKGVVVTLADSAEQYRHAASLRSAAPILRDKDGKIVPLTKRFNLNGSRYLGRRMYLRPDDPRFAISGTQVIPVGEKTLVGLHNISAEKLRKVMKAGGLANPSAAVIDIAKQDHHDYGEVSLVLPSSLVERADGTYPGDAWTPMYPPVEYRAGKDTEKRIKALTKGMPDNLASAIALRIRDYMDGNSRNSGMEYLYMKEQGRELPIEHTPRRYPYISIKQIADRLGIAEPEYWSSDVYQAYEQLLEDQLFDFNLWLEQNGNQEEIDKRKAMVERWRSEGKDAFANTWVGRQSERMSFAAFDSAGYRILRDERDAGEENTGMTLDKASYIVDTEGLRPEFETWLQQKIDGLGYEEVLFGGYTPSGNRRWLPNTVENASKLMNQKSQTNYLERESVNETKAMLMEKFRTLAQIRKHRDILEPDREKIKAAYEAVSSDWNQLGIDFRDYTQTDKRAYQLDDNPFIAIDTALARIQEAMFKRDPIAFLNREYRYSLPADSEFGTRIKEIKERIKNLPSRYFETKFRRPVYLDEFANAVVPVGLPQDLRDGLTGAGMTLFEYDPAEQGSRRAATLKATADEGIRFAISSAKGSPSVARRGNLQYSEGVLPSVAKEMESIKNEAVNNGTFMQAPNGKPTNLDERQWLQVRLRSFKRWFGDWENNPEDSSKVLDENGEPMVAKHGTPFTFTTFDKSKQQQNDAGWLGRGFYFFTKNDDYAAGYARGGQVINAFLNIKNPYYATYADMERLAEMDSKEESERFTQGLIDEGYDGVYFDANLNGEWVAFEPNQIKSATDNNGDFSEENDDIRFAISNQNNDIFYSNAERAVEGIKQEKATPEQWRAMIEKAGGLKAGEDKWIGLSDWLAQQRPTVTPQANETRSQFVERAAAENKRFTLSKQDLLDYIREHKIQIEETHYQEGLSEESQERLADYRAEFDEYFAEAEEATGSLYIRDFADYAWRQMADKYGDDFESAFELDDDGRGNWTINPVYDWGNELSGPAKYFLEGNDNTPINSTRLDYTTEGLENKREIALTVPTIESWNESDDIHFGDAGEGRAIAWVRFGDATATERDADLTRKGAALRDFEEEMQDKYNSAGEELLAMLSPEEREQYDKLNSDVEKSRREYKVLVIDEIQSKRHQSGREQGYQEHIDRPGLHVEEYIPSSQNPNIAFARVTDENGILYGQVQRLSDGKYRPHGNNLQPIGWTDYNTEEEAFNIVKKEAETLNEGGVPVAPFEKNWHELAMKRILRFAAENGYDKVAWTTGDQQAARYNIGEVIDSITRNEDEDYPYSYSVMSKDHGELEYDFDENGIYHDDGDPELDGKSMSDVFGKELAKRLQEMPAGETIDNEGLRIGGEGMRGFYDDILPRFMQKYGKKWGVQVGEVTMPQLEDGYQTMHSIDITDAMRESVLEGQPMFSISGRGVNGTIKPQEGETRSQYIARVAETVKNMTPRNTTIDDAIRFSITVNHNSPYLLKRADGAFIDPETGERLGFDHRFMGKGEGGQAHGWGSYFSVNDIRSYAEGTSLTLPTYKGQTIYKIPKTRETMAVRLILDQGVPRGMVRASFDKLKDEIVRKVRAQEDATWLRRGLEWDEAVSETDAYYENPIKWMNDMEAEIRALKEEDFYLPFRHHYTVDIPDNDGTNYIEENDEPMDETELAILRNNLEQEILKIDKEKNQYYVGHENDLYHNILVKFKAGTKGRDIYPNIAYMLEDYYDNPEEAASKLLNRAGFVGIHYDGRRDGECYVIFDENDAKITDHIRFSIGGVRGAENMDKSEEVTTRMDNLKIAREMEQANKDARVIRDATGWERGADGKWRYYIPDLKIKSDAILDGKPYFFLRDLVDAPELFKAYPDLKDYRVVYTDQLPNSVGGKFYRRSHEIAMNANFYTDEHRVRKNAEEMKRIREELPLIEQYEKTNAALWETDFTDKPAWDAAVEANNAVRGQLVDNPLWKRYVELSKDNDNIEKKPAGESVLIHEIQHAIQDIEHFAKGSSLDDVKAQRKYKEQQADKIQRKIKELEAKLPSPTEPWTDEHDKIAEQIEKLQDEARNVRYNMNVSEAAYKSAAGEVEARNAQTWAELTPAERQWRLFADTEDVAREDQVFLFGDDNVASMVNMDDIVRAADREPQRREGDERRWKTVAEVDKELQEKGYSDESPIRFSVAYHGTGADFDKFLKSKINTGEGSQAFGWGLYFTDAKEIAEDYAKRQARQPKNATDAYLDNKKLNSVDPQTDLDCVAWVLDMNELRNIRTMNPDAARSIVKNTIALKSQELRDRIKFYEGNGATRMVESAREELEYYRRAGELVRETGVPNIEFRGDRNLYTVSIPDNDGANYLIEGKEYSGQELRDIADKVVPLLRKKYGKDSAQAEFFDSFADFRFYGKYATTGDAIYRKLANAIEPNAITRVSDETWKTTSEILNEAGFVGIEYAAGQNYGLKGAPEDAKNYVVFNDKDIEITEHIRFSISGSGTMKPQEGETRKEYIERVAAAVKRMTPRSATIDDAIRFSITVNHNSPYLLKKADGSFVDPETGERLGFDHRFMGKGEGGQAHGWGTYLSVNDLRNYAENNQTISDEIKDAFDATVVNDGGVKQSVIDEWLYSKARRYYERALSEHPSSFRKWLEDNLEHAKSIVDRLSGANFEEEVATLSRQELRILSDRREDVREISTLLEAMKKDMDLRNRHHYTVEIPDNDGTNYLDEIKTLPKPLRRKIAAAVRELPGKPMPSVKYVNYTGGWRQLADMIERNQWAYMEIRDRLVQAFGSKLTDEKRLSNMMHDIGFVGIHYDGRCDGECYVIFDENDAVITDHIRFAISGNGKAPSSDVTEALVKQANDSFRLMQSALRKVSADLRTINAIRTQQFEYDRKVVNMLLDLYNSLLQENSVWAGYMPDTTRRIAPQIVHAIGKKDISAELNTIMDHMVHAQAKAAQRQWDKLRTTPVDKINISGVVMQGKVALQGQHALKAMNEALDSKATIEQLEDQIAQLMDMEDNATDESLKLQYKGQWIGYTIAAQHLERIQHLVDERNQLDIELQAARSNRAIKPSARQQLVANIQQAMRDNYIAQADAYAQSAKDLAEYVTTQGEQAKDFIHRQDANRDKIRSYAQRDLEGLATNPNRNRTRGNIARQIWDAFASPIRDLQSLLRLTGLHAPDGEGYLYNHFMRGWMDGADKERLGIVNASKTLDAKISELTHGKYKTWEEAARKINDASHNMFGITMLNGVDGKDMPVTEEIPLNAGNALYIYAVNKMNDGRMKLNGMNITEEDVQALADKVREQFGQEILDVVDWVQSEFFSQLRNRYNPTHEALFGAPMDAIENYFPLRINANARQQNEDLSEPDTDAARLLAGTSTGAIKRRTRNSLPLDVKNADFFQEVIRHISQMERWNAFAQWNRDANILFSDINFRNRIKGMKGTIYGEGDKLYNYMKDAFRVAIGTYKPKTDTFSEITLNMAKGVTSAKINFRIFTALKQIASFPAFFTYMQDGVFVQSYLRNWLKPHETMKWAKENLPNFEKRVSKRDMGDMRLMQRSTDWQWNKRILEWSSKYGMFFNVFFDTLTCATGARAVYDSHLADYLKKGYSEEDARNRARQDAEQAFNTSQQSSEGAFMSAVQQDRNLVTAALTVFRTSPIQYTRNFFYHTRNLLRKFGEGKRDEQIAFRMGQYKNDGLNDEQARKAAEKDYNKSLRQDIVGFVVYGALLNILWRLVGQVPYLLRGDDDDKKKQILDDATSGGAWFSPFTGLLGGGIVESALDGNGSVADMFAPEMPFTQDIKRAGQYLSNDKYAEFASQALSVLMQSGTGFDPLTASDMISRAVTTLDSEEDLDVATQYLRVKWAILSIPQSQYEQMLIDKVVSGETDEDAALEDYIRYQKIHTAPLTWWLRGEESDEKAEDNAEKRFNKLLTDRDKIHNPEDYEE